MAASIEKLVKTYVKMRDKRAELSDAFKAADSKLTAKMDLIKQALLQHCKDHDVTVSKLPKDHSLGLPNNVTGPVTGSPCTSSSWKTTYLISLRNG